MADRFAVAVGHRLEAFVVFAPFAGVALAADAVHGDGQRFVRLGGDRPKLIAPVQNRLTISLPARLRSSGIGLPGLNRSSPRRWHSPRHLFIHEFGELGIRLLVALPRGFLDVAIVSGFQACFSPRHATGRSSAAPGRRFSARGRVTEFVTADRFFARGSRNRRP